MAAHFSICVWKIPEQRSLAGYSPWGHKELDTKEYEASPTRVCLVDPREGGAWWASVYGVAQSRTRLKRLGSSSKSLGER